MSYRLKAKCTDWFEATLLTVHEKMIEYKIPNSFFFDLYAEVFGVNLIIDSNGFITHLEFTDEDHAIMFLLEHSQ